MFPGLISWDNQPKKVSLSEEVFEAPTNEQRTHQQFGVDLGTHWLRLQKKLVAVQRIVPVECGLIVQRFLQGSSRQPQAKSHLVHAHNTFGMFDARPIPFQIQWGRLGSNVQVGLPWFAPQLWWSTEGWQCRQGRPRQEDNPTRPEEPE